MPAKLPEDSGFNTRQVHGGTDGDHPLGAVAMPIFQTSTYGSTGPADPRGVKYIRYNNTPNQTVAAARIAALHGAEAGLVTASGMAAVSAMLMSHLKAGDHALFIDSLYGGTHAFATEQMPRFGIETDLVPIDDADAWQAAVKPNTRLIYSETLTNPLVRVPDHQALVAFARAHDLVSVIDNTFASPVLFRPIAHGFDIVLESASKYLNGHSDIVAGVVVGGDGPVGRVRDFLAHHGGSLDPFAAFLLLRGLMTLSLRVAHQCRSAAEIAQALRARGDVRMVAHPSLPSHPDHRRASALLDGYGAMLAFDIAGGQAAAERVQAALRLITVAPSLGGPETLITRPAATSHVGLPAQDRERVGVTDSLFRLSVGFEDTADLLADLDRALASAGAARAA